MGLEWVVLPAAGSLIGWVTNHLAIRMLFRPKAPVTLFRRFRLQGVLPRRQAEFARAVAETVERELLPVHEVFERIDLAKYQGEAVDAVLRVVDRRLEESLPELIPFRLRRLVADYIRSIVSKEAALVVAELSDRVKERLAEDVRFGELVHEKVSRLDTDQLEGIVVRVAGAELRAIEVLGAVLGLFIGVIQAAFLSVSGG